MPNRDLVFGFFRLDWIVESSLHPVLSDLVTHLRVQRYSESTIRTYLKAVAHFAYWTKREDIVIPHINRARVREFLIAHLPLCACPSPCNRSIADVRAGLKQLLIVLQQRRLIDGDSAAVAVPIAGEIKQFEHYLLNVCGLAAATSKYRMRLIEPFLIENFGDRPIDLSLLRPEHVDDFIMRFAERWKPSSLGVVRATLRSYFRFRALQGDCAESLTVTLPVLPNRRHITVSSALTEDQVILFLRAFDTSRPTGKRDYAMARCLLDLGLREEEVVQLRLSSFDWRNGTITVSKSKGRHVKQFPLPWQTGKAIAEYLQNGRPNTSSCAVFVRHVAPFDKPITAQVVQHAMNGAFARCGLKGDFAGSHVLRRTMAIRLQRAGAPLKEIADMLRHKSLDSATSYAKVDFDALRKVALPWPGRRA